MISKLFFIVLFLISFIYHANLEIEESRPACIPCKEQPLLSGLFYTVRVSRKLVDALRI